MEPAAEFTAAIRYLRKSVPSTAWAARRAEAKASEARQAWDAHLAETFPSYTVGEAASDHANTSDQVYRNALVYFKRAAYSHAVAEWNERVDRPCSEERELDALNREMMDHSGRLLGLGYTQKEVEAAYYEARGKVYAQPATK